jgi:hypothetical protein
MVSEQTGKNTARRGSDKAVETLMMLSAKSNINSGS